MIHKYGAISLAQSIVSMLYGAALLLRFCRGWYHTESVLGVSYLMISTVVQSTDMLITIICIYYGFVKKNTAKSYCALCWDCCSRTRDGNGKRKRNRKGQYEVLWDKAPGNRPGSSCNVTVFHREHDTKDILSASDGIAIDAHSSGEEWTVRSGGTPS